MVILHINIRWALSTTISTLNLTMSDKRLRRPTERVLAMAATQQPKWKHTGTTDTMASKRSKANVNSLPDRDISPNSDVPAHGMYADVIREAGDVIDMTNDDAGDVGEPPNSGDELGK